MCSTFLAFNEAADNADMGPDPYTVAHLADIRTRIGRTLDAAYVIQR
jgi:hypothetical protein